MVEVEKLEDILHREKINEPLPEYEGQTQKEWHEETDAIIDKYVSFGNKKTGYNGKVSSVEYGRWLKKHSDLQRCDFQITHLKSGWNMIKFAALYNIAILIFLLLVYIS